MAVVVFFLSGVLALIKTQQEALTDSMTMTHQSNLLCFRMASLHPPAGPGVDFSFSHLDTPYKNLLSFSQRVQTLVQKTV